MRVSVNVYDSKGAIVRSLLCGAPRQKGRQREFWDGRDQAGNPLPAGEYSWKLLAMPARLKTEYLLTAATNYLDSAPEPMQETEHFLLVSPGTHGGPIAMTAGPNHGTARVRIEQIVVTTTTKNSKDTRPAQPKG